MSDGHYVFLLRCVFVQSSYRALSGFYLSALFSTLIMGVRERGVVTPRQEDLWRAELYRTVKPLVSLRLLPYRSCCATGHRIL